MQFFVDYLLKLFNNNVVLCVVCFALIPVIEIRGAIPLGINLGLSAINSAIFSLLGSLFACLILIYVLPYFFKILEKTKFYANFSHSFQAKIKKLSEKKINIYVALMLFVSIPLPLTGVTTACIISSMLKLNKSKSFLFIMLGNIISSAIITLTSVFLGDFSIAITVMFIVAFLIILAIYMLKLLKTKIDL